jgi:hypothetical protein
VRRTRCCCAIFATRAGTCFVCLRGYRSVPARDSLYAADRGHAQNAPRAEDLAPGSMMTADSHCCPRHSFRPSRKEIGAARIAIQKRARTQVPLPPLCRQGLQLKSLASQRTQAPRPKIRRLPLRKAQVLLKPCREVPPPRTAAAHRTHARTRARAWQASASHRHCLQSRRLAPSGVDLSKRRAVGVRGWWVGVFKSGAKSSTRGVRAGSSALTSLIPESTLYCSS